MTPADIRAKAAWLYDLTKFESPTPVLTADDLRGYADRIEFNCFYQLSPANLDQIRDLVESLEPPEVQLARQRKREEVRLVEQRKSEQSWERAEKWWDWKFSRGRNLSKLGAAARKSAGEETRLRISRSWKRLGNLPERERAREIASILDITPRHVRRVVGQQKLK